MTRSVKALLDSKDWESMSPYELEIVRGTIEATRDSRYWEARARRKKEQEQEPTMTERTFLQRLYDHEQSRTTPVVDEAFIKTFSSLSWEDQCCAMNHIFFLKNATGVGSTNHETVVYKKRLEKLYENWLEDQTETWVGITYTAPIESGYWNGVKPETLPHIQGEKLAEEEDPFLIGEGVARV